jgi:hypothetical protein
MIVGHLFDPSTSIPQATTIPQIAKKILNDGNKDSGGILRYERAD